MDNLEYVTATQDVWDNCHTSTFSIWWIHHFIDVGGNDVTDKTSIYWCLPGTTHKDGLCLIDNHSHDMAMMEALKEVSYLCLMVDHSDFIKNLRQHMILPIPEKYTRNLNGLGAATDTGETSAASAVISEIDRKSEAGDVAEDDSDTDSEFYDSDFDAEDGDDDLFLENIDPDVNDHNEQEERFEEEDDAGLDHEDLNLSREQFMQLKYKFKEFNLEVDMEAPQFKTGMLFSSMSEFRKALNAYAVNERVKLRKPRNEATRMHAQCEEGCPWMIKVAQDNSKESIVVKEFCDQHKCERLWEDKSLTAPFLTTIFIDEFRDNQRMDLTAFRAKVHRRFNLTPSRFKLGRARKAALTIIHGDEAQQFSLLCDYG